MAELVAVVDRLRSPGGCPWDQAQDFASMRPYLLEECHEVLDTIDAGDPARLAEELGDLLFEVVFLARLGEELPDGDRFDIEAVAGRIVRKMVERHPHVFGGEAGARAGEDPGGIAAWEARKRRHGGTRSRLDGVPRALPALLRTHRQGEKAAAVGFDWPDARAVLAKVHEELAELEAALETGDAGAIAHEYGDALMALATLGRHLGAPPEDALRAANDRFARRFREVEAIARAEGLDLEALDAAALDALWERAKARLAADGE